MGKSVIISVIIIDKILDVAKNGKLLNKEEAIYHGQHMGKGY